MCPHCSLLEFHCCAARGVGGGSVPESDVPCLLPYLVRHRILVRSFRFPGEQYLVFYFPWAPLWPMHKEIAAYERGLSPKCLLVLPNSSCLLQRC